MITQNEKLPPTYQKQHIMLVNENAIEILNVKILAKNQNWRH